MRQLGVQYFVAANEADCELASLDRSGRVDAIVTRDGDLCILYAQIVVWEQTIDWYGTGEFKFASLPLFLEQVGKDLVKPKSDKYGLVQRLSTCSSKQVYLCLALMAAGAGCDYGSIKGAGWVKCSKALCAINGDVTPELSLSKNSPNCSPYLTRLQP